MAKWIQPFSDMTSLSLCHVLGIIGLPPVLPEYRLGDSMLDLLKTIPLQLSFQTPLETWTFQEDQGAGPCEPLRDGDPLTYAAGLVDNEMVPVPIQTPMRCTGAWKDLDFFEHRELDVSMFAHVMEEEEEGEVAEGDEPSPLL